MRTWQLVGTGGALALLVLFGAGSCKKESTRRKKSKPEITLVVPQGGSVQGGGRVAVLTRSFKDDFQVFPPQVMFGSQPATIQEVLNPVELIVLTPASAAPGPVDVTVTTTGNVQTADCAGCFEYTPVPPPCTVSGVIPSVGDVAGLEVITILGQDFEPYSDVFFGSDGTQWIQAPRVIYLDSSTLEVTTPPEPNGQAATVDIRVDTPSGRTCRGQYTYTYPDCTVFAVVPTTGSTLGGEAVTVTGMNFDPVSSEVDFDGIPATIVGRAATQIDCLTPPRTMPGSVTVTVRNPLTQTSCELVDGYTYFLPAGLCSLEGVEPSAGMMAGGETITIHGADFEIPPDPDPLVELGQGGTWVPAPVTNNPGDGMTLEVTPPAWALAETVDIRVTNQVSGQSCTLTDAYEYVAPGQCVLFTVTPNEGPTAGGYTVVIEGAGLDPSPTQVLFGSEPVGAGQITVLGPTSVEVTVPLTFNEGKVDITYVNPGPSPCVLVNGFEYKNPSTGCTITGIIPDTGPRTGGTWITIKGTGFPDDVRVYFNMVEANPYLTRVIDSETLELVSPGILNPKCVDVTVIGVTIPVVCTLADGFCYTGGCDIGSIAPASGPRKGGEVVTILGSSFDPDGHVRFGDNFSPWVDFVSPTEVRAEVPPSPVDGPVEVAVLGIAAVQCRVPDGYTYDPGAGGNCDVWGVMPASGPPQGGNVVDIVGNNFESAGGGPAVLFGYQAATSVTYVNAGLLQVVVPRALFDGIVDVVVVNESGSTCTLPASYAYDPLPTCSRQCTISEVRPESGPVTAGNFVRVLGDGFCPGAIVWFGDQSVAGQVLSETDILAYPPPASAPGWVPVAVQQPSGSVCYVDSGYEYR